jgi:LPS export ABC transporter protein LptC
MNVYKIKSQSIVAICIVTMLFACNSDFNQANKFNQEVNVPQGVTKDVNLFYTDSGIVKANLRSPRLNDYSQEEFAYQVFPIGVEVDFFNTDSTKNTIYADSAIVFKNSSLIDMRKNVRIVTSDSLILTTNQLYWDTDRKWVFTDRDYKIQLANGTENEDKGFDADQDFNFFSSRSNTGVQVIEEDDK